MCVGKDPLFISSVYTLAVDDFFFSMLAGILVEGLVILFLSYNLESSKFVFVILDHAINKVKFCSHNF